MARVIFLSGHFRQAAAAVKAAIPDMNGKALRRRGFHIKELPSVTRNFWNGIGKNDNNCYNFALHRMKNDFLQPGQLATQINPLIERNLDKEKSETRYDDDRLDQYTSFIRKCLKLDGHTDLGATLSLRNGFMPVVLFMGHRLDLKDAGLATKGHDYHFYALRRTDGSDKEHSYLTWAHKKGDGDVEICPSAPECMFASAYSRGYHTFGGFWLVKNPQLSHK